MSEPFDHGLYDAVMAEADTHAPTSETMPTVHQRHTFAEWYDGWDACAEVAARIAAERVTVIPEGWWIRELWYRDALGRYECELRGKDKIVLAVTGIGPTWHDALAAAIKAAEGDNA